MKNSGDNVFDAIPVGQDEARLFNQFIMAHDLAANSRKAITQDVRKFARWFASVNKEPFKLGRVTTRDVTDFRDHLRREKKQAVATVNRCLVTLRRFFGWLAEQGTFLPTSSSRSRSFGASSLHRRAGTLAGSPPVA